MSNIDVNGEMVCMVLLLLPGPAASLQLYQKAFAPYLSVAESRCRSEDQTRRFGLPEQDSSHLTCGPGKQGSEV